MFPGAGAEKVQLMELMELMDEHEGSPSVGLRVGLAPPTGDGGNQGQPTQTPGQEFHDGGVGNRPSNPRVTEV